VDLLVIAKKFRPWTNRNLLALVSKKGSHYCGYSLHWVAAIVAFVVSFDRLAEAVNVEVRTGAGRRLSLTFQLLVAACYSIQTYSPWSASPVSLALRRRHTTNLYLLPGLGAGRLETMRSPRCEIVSTPAVRSRNQPFLLSLMQPLREESALCTRPLSRQR